jgi:glutamine amidotransferase
MCRHLAYLGPPICLDRLLFQPSHSLEHQSWAPRDMRSGGTINADGFGVGWYPGGSAEPVRYRRDCPMWTDPGLRSLASATQAGALLAAVRSATIGMPVVANAAAPFGEGAWLFSYNGKVLGWPDTLVPVAGRLPVRDLLTLEAPTDAAVLWLVVRDRLRSGATPAAAVADTLLDVAAAAPGSTANLLLTDGHTVVATTFGHALSTRRDARSILVSSEPLDDDPGWQDVPDGQLLVATAATTSLSPLPLSPLPILPLPIES